jgi:hypothetical protein
MFERFKSHTARAAKRPAKAPEERPAAPPRSNEDLARAERAAAEAKGAPAPEDIKAAELGGPDGPEPTRYGDWERKGICYDF